MNSFRIILFLFIPLLLSNCSYELDKTEVPKDLIPKDTFTLILKDMMVLESYYNTQELDFITLQKSLNKAVNPLLDKYNIDSTRYATSMDYYGRQQDKLSDIYNTIQDSLTLEAVKLNTNDDNKDEKRKEK